MQLPCCLNIWVIQVSLVSGHAGGNYRLDIIFFLMNTAIFFDAVPSPKGMAEELTLTVLILFTARAIASGVASTRIFAPASIVSGHSVVDRTVTQGVFNRKASLTRPPESVRTQAASFVNESMAVYSTGSITETPPGSFIMPE